MLHAKNRQKGIIHKLSNRGLCVSYERTQEISTALSNIVYAQLDRDGLVCPTKLKRYVFTARAVDNIDRNPNARNAMNSFHWTAISMVQFPTQEKPGTDMQPILINHDFINKNALNLLPAEY